MNRASAKKSLSRRISLIQLALLITMAAVLAVASYSVFRSTFLNFYNEKAQDIVRIVADQTDWEKLEHFAQTGEPDSYSESLIAFYDSVKVKFTGVDYLYLFVPGETSFMYLIEAKTPEDDPENLAHWGDVFEYTSYEYEKLLPDVRAGKPSTELMLMRTEMGAGVETWAPVFDAEGNVRAMVEADYALTNLEREINVFVLRIVLFILICTAVVLAVMFFYMRRNVTEPIVRLNTSVDNYEHGNFELNTDAFKKDDELRNLALSFTDMTRRIDEYTEEVAKATAEKGRIDAEISVAKEIQTELLPSEFPAYPDRSDFDIYASLYSSNEICGDFYDFFLIDDDHLAMVLGDISGKGVPAAMFMVIVKTLIKNRALQGYSPAEVLQNVSEQLLEGNNAALYATIWLAVLDLSTGKGIAANAGQEHPTLCRAGKRFELQEYKHSPPIAAMEGVRFRDHGFQLWPGDTIFMYTDGVKEARNPKNEVFGTRRILEVLNREPDATPSVLLQTMKTSVDSYIGEAAQTDDMMMLSLKYYGRGEMRDADDQQDEGRG